MYVNSRCVPWYSISEYRFVLSKLKSSNSDDLHEALVSMHVWICRIAPSKLPRAILCTYELLLAKLHSSTQAFANAIMRFISLVSSEMQDKNRSGFAIPISSLILNAGLPSWMSDLRNEIAHGIMPSEDSLTKAYGIAIQWLLKFWESHADVSPLKVDLSQIGEIKWTSSLNLVDEFLSCPIRHVSITKAYAKYLVRMAKSGCRGVSNSELGAVLRVFQKFSKVNNLILAIYTLLPAEGAIFWANTWLEAFKAFTESQDHEFHHFYSRRDLSKFPWRHCLEQVSLASCPEGFDMISFLQLFQPNIPSELKSNLLSIRSPNFSALTTTDFLKPKHTLLPWTYDSSERWWRVPLGEKLCNQNAETNLAYQGLPNQDSSIRCQVGQDKDEQGQCQIQDQM
ncbi:unnamed protein product [Hymenolepis diminuta]|uniref:Uncharacterized protein n=1 Tax=Hymenolepis diminuta TaxID=6216 RepID=A0A564YRA3_HYMDI|nr:unnamed protein product [Hymenolepis diminuta]